MAINTALVRHLILRARCHSTLISAVIDVQGARRRHLSVEDASTCMHVQVSCSVDEGER